VTDIFEETLEDLKFKFWISKTYICFYKVNNMVRGYFFCTSAARVSETFEIKGSISIASGAITAAESISLPESASLLEGTISPTVGELLVVLASVLSGSTSTGAFWVTEVCFFI
jgi:hypothetical protein